MKTGCQLQSGCSLWFAAIQYNSNQLEENLKMVVFSKIPFSETLYVFCIVIVSIMCLWARSIFMMLCDTWKPVFCVCKNLLMLAYYLLP